MHRIASLGLLMFSTMATAKRKPVAQAVMTVPSIESVVESEGFVPTLSQSEVYRPGAVLVLNAQGGHDVVVQDCVGVAPTVSMMSQSSIATSLSAGVSARLVAVRGEVAAGVEKRLSFVDPEQRTISFGDLNATETCKKKLQQASRFVDLSQAILLHDVLVAQIQNTVCIKATAKGKVVVLGEAEARAYSECVQESDAQVPLGYKAVPLTKVIAVAPSVNPVVRPAAVPPPPPGVSATARSNVHFGDGGDLGVSAKLKRQRCEAEANKKGEAARARSLLGQVRLVQAEASTAWRKRAAELESCTGLERADRSGCIESLKAWLTTARSMLVELPAGVEPIETSCGVLSPAFEAESTTVAAADLVVAEALLDRLQAPDGVSPGQAWSGGSGYAMVAIPAGGFEMGSPSTEKGRDDDEVPHKVTLSKGFLMGRTEVTQGLWRLVMGSNPSTSEYKDVSLLGDELPVQNVDWCDAVAFANKLSARDGLSAAYTGVSECKSTKSESVRWNRSSTGYRLPTEAEWEYAAKSGARALFAGVDDYKQVCEVGNVGDLGAATRFDWSSDWSRQCTDRHVGLAPVGSYRGNSYGLHDMTGNVWEWCWDRYGAYGGTSVDPVGAQSGSSRVGRGGSWYSGPRNARVAFRGRNPPDNRYNSLGLRLLRTIP